MKLTMKQIFEAMCWFTEVIATKERPKKVSAVTLESDGGMRAVLTRAGLGAGAHYCSRCKTDDGPHQVAVAGDRALFTHRCGAKWVILDNEGSHEAKGEGAKGRSRRAGAAA